MVQSIMGHSEQFSSNPHMLCFKIHYFESVPELNP